MDNWTTAALTTMNPVTRESLDVAIADLKAKRESLAAAMAKLGPRPSDVFVYPGPIDRFTADLAASGVEVRGNMIELPGVPQVPFGLPPLGSLQCWQIGGNVWVAGDYRDVEDARNGKVPLKWLVPRPR